MRARPARRKWVKSVDKTSKLMGDQKTRRKKRNRNPENAKEKLRRDHMFDKKPW